jgi:hypothetical protein
MWYHYVVGFLAAYFALYGIYNQFYGNYSSMVWRVVSGCFTAMWLYVVLWAYRSVTAPPPMLGMGRRR